MNIWYRKLITVIDKHKLWLNTEGKEGERADLTDVNLSYTNLSYTNFSYANLTNADLTNVDLYKADLSNANLTDADLFNSNLHKADLSNANLSNSSLYKADLTDVNLTDANLTDVNLSYANLTNITGKDIRTFRYLQHQATYVDGYIRIGCKYMSVEDWLDKGREIGKKYNYTEEEIEQYMKFIESCKEEIR